MRMHFDQPNEIALLTTVLCYKTGVDKLSDKDYKEYQRILKTFRESKTIHSMDSDAVKNAIEDFIDEMDKGTLNQIMEKLA